MLILIVAGGPDKGRIYELLEDQPITLGREGDPVRLSDRKSSRKHARLWAEGGKWYARDLGSRHGTHVNALRIEGQHELADGDHIQIGKTLLVMARMPVEQAERLALLGDEAGRGAATGPLPFPAFAHRGRLIAAGAGLAAAVLIGSNAMLYVSSSNQADELRSEIAAARSATLESNQALLDEVRARTAAAAAPARDALLEEILATVSDGARAAREQEKLLNRIGETIALQPDSGALFESILARLDEAPKQTQMLATLLNKVSQQPAAPAATDPAVKALLAQVKTMTRAARDQQLALAQKADQTQSLLRETLAQVKDRPDIERIAQAIREDVEARADGNAALLDKVLANLGEQKALAARLAELRTAVEAQPAATVAAVREIVEAMPSGEGKGDTQAVLAAVERVRQALPGDVTQKLDEVLARLDTAPTPRQLAAVVNTALDQRDDATAKAIERVAAELDARPTRDEMLAALDKAAASPDAALLAKLEALTAALPAPDAGDTTRQMLAKVLAEVRNHEPITKLREDLSELAEMQATQEPSPMLGEILAAVRERGDADAHLAAIHELLEAWPAQTEQMLREMLAAVRESAQPDAPALDGVLDDIRSRALARIDELNAAIRSDVRAELAAVPDAPGTPGILAAPGATALPGAARAGSVLMSPRADERRTIEAIEGPVLTPTEQAYKLAFETGQPVTIGAGVINASTGQVSEGRTLDPSAARAAGIKHWREWYLMDDFAERMRLQKQAMRYTGDAGGPPIISLPAASPVPVAADATPEAPGAPKP